MLLLFLAFVQLLRRLRNGFQDPQFQALGIAALLLMCAGTIFYNRVEHWSILNSFYFSVITLATVGYGDFVPKTDLGKIFTVIYIFLGVGTLVSFITLLASRLGRKKPFLKK
jgi:voltage-gated potassium channel Kch